MLGEKEKGTKGSWQKNYQRRFHQRRKKPSELLILFNHYDSTQEEHKVSKVKYLKLLTIFFDSDEMVCHCFRSGRNLKPQ